MVGYSTLTAAGFILSTVPFFSTIMFQWQMFIQDTINSSHAMRMYDVAPWSIVSKLFEYEFQGGWSTFWASWLLKNWCRNSNHHDCWVKPQVWTGWWFQTFYSPLLERRCHSICNCAWSICKCGWSRRIFFSHCHSTWSARWCCCSGRAWCCSARGDRQRCIEAMGPNFRPMLLRCCHGPFHRHCLTRMLQATKKKSCPVCRFLVPRHEEGNGPVAGPAAQGGNDPIWPIGAAGPIFISLVLFLTNFMVALFKGKRGNFEQMKTFIRKHFGERILAEKHQDLGRYKKIWNAKSSPLVVTMRAVGQATQIFQTKKHSEPKCRWCHGKEDLEFCRGCGRHVPYSSWVRTKGSERFGAVWGI